MRRYRYKKLLVFFESTLLLMIETLLFAYIWYGYYIHYIKLSFYHRGNYAVIGSYTLILFLITKLYDGFKLGYLRLMDVLYSQILALLCSNVLMYIQLCIIGRDYMNPMKLVEMTIAELVVIVAWVLLWSWVYTKIYPPRRMLLVYGGKPPKNLVGKLHSRKDKYQVCEMISAQKGTDIVCRRIDRYENVVLCEMPPEVQSSIVEYCFHHSVRSYIIPKITDIMLLGAEQIHLFDTPILLLRNQGLDVEQVIVKRFMDLVISFLMLILASPLMLLIAFCIKVQDGGPVIYKQKRLTKDGKEFDIYKFRSMRTDSERSGARLAQKGDSRVTPVGKVIRNLHFDELPQLFHILKGDMSLVGPRPERPEIAREYQKQVPEFEFRLKVKAGLTGYAQVYGKYNTTPEDKLKLDLFYIEHYSVWMDIKLLLLTFKILFQKENTEGIDHGQVTAVKGR
jgi:exopolysaccharide biosynthesis polyprenyl glycosylphosphotransferase